MIRKFFQTLSLRERILLAVFFWAGLIVWATATIKSLLREYASDTSLRRQLALQESWLERKPEIIARLATIKEQFDPTRTYNGVQLAAKVDQLARDHNLDREVTSPESQTSEAFTIHSVRLQLRRAQISDLIYLDQALQQERPYLALESFQLAANSRDPNYLEATFQIVAFELNDASATQP